jgi:mycofactocin precursor peptide peptidase
VTVRPLDRRTTAEQKSSPGRTLLLPLGSFEQHGPHLPLTTDTIIARTICQDVATARDVDVAPVLAYGASDEHRGFSGLLSMGTDATAATVAALVRSARESWGAVIIVSAHGGNVNALNHALPNLRTEGLTVQCWFARDAGGDAHAGVTETSVMLSIDPSLVDLDRYPGAVELPPDWFERSRTEGVRSVTASGVLGAPSRASALYGQDLRRQWTTELVALIDQVTPA